MHKLNLELLDRLAKEATPGLWVAVGGEAPAGAKDGPKYPTTTAVMIYADGDCESHPIADFSCNHTCRMEYEQEGNARFVAELVSAWPAIRERLLTP